MVGAMSTIGIIVAALAAVGISLHIFFMRRLQVQCPDKWERLFQTPPTTRPIENLISPDLFLLRYAASFLRRNTMHSNALLSKNQVPPLSGTVVSPSMWKKAKVWVTS